jgi:hypothetical protein
MNRDNIKGRRSVTARSGLLFPEMSENPWEVRRGGKTAVKLSGSNGRGSVTLALWNLTSMPAIHCG